MAGVFYSKEQVRDLSQSAPRGSAYEWPYPPRQLKRRRGNPLGGRVHVGYAGFLEMKTYRET